MLHPFNETQEKAVQADMVELGGEALQLPFGLYLLNKMCEQTPSRKHLWASPIPIDI